MKNKMKKWIALVLTGCMLGGILTGCSSKAQEETSDPSQTVSESNSNEKVTIRCSWWGGDTRHKAMLNAIDLYEKENPNVTIEGEYQGFDGYYEKMMTSLSSETAPDLMLFKKEWLPVSQNYLADLSKLPVDTSTLAEGLLEKSGTYNGVPILFSAMVTGQVLFVNTEFASQFGIDINKTYSWDEFMELGKKVHEQDAETYLMTADADVLNRLIIPAYIGQVTGESLVNEDTYELNFTKDQMRDAFQLILDMYNSNTLEPFGEGSVFAGQMDQNTKWINGKIGLLLDVTSGFAKYKASIPATLEVMPIPRNADAKNSGVDFAGNTGFCINENSEAKEETAKFLDYLMNNSEEALILKNEFGYNSTSTAIKALEKEGLVDKTLKRAIDIAQKDSMTINSISINTELETVREDLLQAVIYNDITPEEAAEEIMTKYKDLLLSLKSN